MPRELGTRDWVAGGSREFATFGARRTWASSKPKPPILPGIGILAVRLAKCAPSRSDLAPAWFGRGGECPRPLGVLGVIGDNNPRLHTRVVIVRPFSRVQPTCQERCPARGVFLFCI